MSFYPARGIHDAELLAPAGGWSQLKAAVRFGANAVYLACDKFGMRARAANFSLEDIAAAVSYAHQRGVRVHIAINTLMDSCDIALLPSYLEVIAQAGADALIVSDMGAFALAREYAPSLELHISTQASVCNARAARAWYELGASRIVCAREMSLEEIARMRADTPADLALEAFVHGSMCVAYSGRCLLSAAMTGRSGNKGACAQSCRWGYALMEEKRPGEYFEIEEDARGSYILNAQDLNMIAHLDELYQAGVSSFKIEGRNKQAFYVASVVGAYRSVMDGGDVQAAQAELCTVSHRPYSTGFYFGAATQTPERDGYVKECVHVASVEECVRTGEDSWTVTAICHNRFATGDTLETVRPHRARASFTMGRLLRLAPADGGLPFVERGNLALSDVRALSYEACEPVANRSKEHYVFETPFSLDAGDYLCKRI